jgi:hypothetical protein
VPRFPTSFSCKFLHLITTAALRYLMVLVPLVATGSPTWTFTSPTCWPITSAFLSTLECWVLIYQPPPQPEMCCPQFEVLIIHSLSDFICNYVGGDMWTSNLNWPGKTAFNNAPFGNWTVQGKVAGFAKAAQGLTFLEVANAGHLAPMVRLCRIRRVHTLTITDALPRRINRSTHWTCSSVCSPIPPSLETTIKRAVMCFEFAETVVLGTGKWFLASHIGRGRE